MDTKLVEEFLQLTHLTKPEVCKCLGISPRSYYRLVEKTGIKAKPDPKANEVRILLTGGESVEDVSEITEMPRIYVVRIRSLMKSWPTAPNVKAEVLKLEAQGMWRKTIAKKLDLLFDEVTDIVTPKSKRLRRRWTNQEQKQLLKLDASGVSGKEIARTLGRTLQAIHGRLFRIKHLRK